MNELSLFTGVGGGLLGTHLLGWKPVCAVEIEPYCREVLMRRQRDGMLPLFPIWDDIKTFDGKPWNGLVDVVTAGFPCQPFSVAGKQRGESDERNMWPETIRVIREVGPRFALLENVPGLVRHDYFGQILGDLADAGFDAEWDVISAAYVGAPHLRKRLWIVADSNGEGLSESTRGQLGCVRGEEEAQPGREFSGRCPEEGRRDWWATEPDVGRVAHGVPHRVDRLKGLGNAQVPAVVRAAWELLREKEPNA